MRDVRERLLDRFAQNVAGAARSGVFTRRRPVAIPRIQEVNGPRAGGLDLYAGVDAGDLLDGLRRSDSAVLRAFFPPEWRFVGDPQVYVRERSIRIEASWPDDLADMSVSIDDLGHGPNSPDVFKLGKAEDGGTVFIRIDDEKNSILFAGTTGSGKTVALISTVAQLALKGNWIVIIDGKGGRDWKPMNRLPNLIGRVAVTPEDALAALGWSLNEMRRRYASPDPLLPRLIVVIDEMQRFVDVPGFVPALDLLSSQGREARVSSFIATQRPTADTIGRPAIKANTTARVAMLVPDMKSSEVALDKTTPRADRLCGRGDSYALVPGKNIERVQIAYYPERQLGRILSAEPRLSEWPPFSAEQIGNDRPRPMALPETDEELVVSLIHAHLTARNGGRPGLFRAIEQAEDALGIEIKKPGSERGDRILERGRVLDTLIEQLGFRLSRIGGLPA